MEAIPVARRERSRARFNKKDLIEALKLEADIIAGGGYGRSVRTPCEGRSKARTQLGALTHSTPSEFLLQGTNLLPLNKLVMAAKLLDREM